MSPQPKLPPEPEIGPTVEEIAEQGPQAPDVEPDKDTVPVAKSAELQAKAEAKQIADDAKHSERVQLNQTDAA